MRTIKVNKKTLTLIAVINTTNVWADLSAENDSHMTFRFCSIYGDSVDTVLKNTPELMELSNLHKICVYLGLETSTLIDCLKYEAAYLAA